MTDLTSLALGLLRTCCRTPGGYLWAAQSTDRGDVLVLDLYLRQRIHAGKSGPSNPLQLLKLWQNVIGLSIVRALAGMGYAIATPAASGIIGTHFPPGKPKTMAFAAMAGGGSIVLGRTSHLTPRSGRDRCWDRPASRRALHLGQPVCPLHIHVC